MLNFNEHEQFQYLAFSIFEINFGKRILKFMDFHASKIIADSKYKFSFEIIFSSPHTDFNIHFIPIPISTSFSHSALNEKQNILESETCN